MQKHGKKIHMYAFELCAAISDDFRNSPEMAAHDLNTYIFTFTKNWHAFSKVLRDETSVFEIVFSVGTFLF